MPGRYTIDTNIAIALLNNDPAVTLRWSEADEVLLPAPADAELLFGAMRSSEHRRADNLLRVFTLAASMDFTPCEEAACESYATVKASLAEAGRPVPENDLCVPTCTMACNATLVTRDAHFDAIEDLPRETW